MSTNSDELNLHYHLSRELLDRYNSLHLHLHLSAPESAVPAAALTPAVHTLATHSILVPQNGSTTVNMLNNASGNFICAYGLEIDSGGNPPPSRDIRAQVFYGPCPSSPNIPSSPTSGASKARFCPSGLPSIASTCNWAFHPLFGNLLPCPPVPSGGPATYYMVEWANYGTDASPFWIVGGVSCFTAILGSTTDCHDRIAALAGGLALARIESAQPREYRLIVDGPRLEVLIRNLGLSLPGAADPIVLSYEDAISTVASPEWTGGCNRRGRWRLRVTQHANSLIGLLSLTHVAGVPLKSNLVWRKEGWDLTAANRLEPFRPVDLCDAAISCLVEPN